MEWRVPAISPTFCDALSRSLPLNDSIRAMLIYCCGCQCDVDARLTSGVEIYPHRKDLASLRFYKCDACGNYVGCHRNRKSDAIPLGIIPTEEIRKARVAIHAILDPLWKRRLVSRNQLYATLSEYIGKQYHTAEIRTMEEAELILRAVKRIEAKVKEMPKF